MNKLFFRYQEFVFVFLKRFKEGIFITFFFFISVFSITNQEIVKQSIEYFDGKPGFTNIFNLICIRDKLNNYSFKKNPKGHLFELETAMYYKDILNEDILGFNLNIVVKNKIGKPEIEVLLGKDNVVKLRPTEYDVITKKHCIESKSGKCLSFQKCHRQFKKEIDMLRWFRLIKDEIECKTMFFKVLDNNLIINGISTAYKDVYLSCNWVGLNYENNLKISWNDIINLLSSLEFRLALKRELSSDKLIDFFKQYCKITNINSLVSENLVYNL